MEHVRIFFEKKNAARFMSHLDLMRCFGRALRRAEIPFWYTEGFNPHPFMTFALPLSLGTTGLCESVDIKLVDDMTGAEIAERLNRSLPEGLYVTKVAPPSEKPSTIAYSQYLIELNPQKTSADEVYSKLTEFLAQESIIAVKLNKKRKPVDVDLKRMMREPAAEIAGNTVNLRVMLASGCSESCNPSLLISAFEQYSGYSDTAAAITRERILTSDIKDFS